MPTMDNRFNLSFITSYVLNILVIILLRSHQIFGKGAKNTMSIQMHLSAYVEVIDPSLSPPLSEESLSNPMLATVTRHRRPVMLLTKTNMPKQCGFVTCKGNSRYPQTSERGVEFLPFPKPKTQEEKC